MGSPFQGTWYNQHSSQMVLNVDQATGKVTGTYQTGVGAPKPGEKFPLVGFVADDLLSFTVNFGVYGSLTSWAGQLTGEADGDGEAHIDTLWHLAKNVPDAEEKDKLWAAMLTGADTFTRTPPSAGEAKALTALPSHPLSVR